MSDAAPLLLGAEEAARVLGISRRTLYTQVALGCLPKPLKIGARSVWSYASLQAFAQELEASAVSEFRGSAGRSRPGSRHHG